MTRTKPILLGEDFLNKRTFQRDPQKVAVLNRLINAKFNKVHDFTHTSEDVTLLAADITKKLAEAEAARVQRAANNRYNGWGGNNNNTHAVDNSDMLAEAMKDFLVARYGYSAALGKELKGYLRDHFYGTGNGSDVAFVSSIMLNEFLNGADDAQRYGDFLEEHWDTLYDKYENGQFTEYAWTAEVFSDTGDQGLLSFRPRLSKKDRMLLEDLTLADVKLIRAQRGNNSLSWITNAAFPTRLKSILSVGKGEKSVGTPVNAVTNKLYSAFAKVQGEVSEGSSFSLVTVNRTFVTEVLQEIRLTADKAKVSSDLMFTDKAKTYADFLYANAGEFNIYEMFFAIVPIVHTKWFARTGSREQVLDFFLEVLEKYDNSSAVDIFRMIGESGATYDLELPTLLQWKKALDAGTLDMIFDASITMALVAVSEKTVPKNTKQIVLRHAFRKSFR